MKKILRKKRFHPIHTYNMQYTSQNSDRIVLGTTDFILGNSKVWIFLSTINEIEQSSNPNQAQEKCQNKDAENKM